MQALLSPGSLVTIAGAVLTVIGTIAYATDIPNLSLPTIFYGIPILLGGLALKSSELPPPKRLTPASRFKHLRDLPESEPLRKLLAQCDVTRNASIGACGTRHRCNSGASCNCRRCEQVVAADSHQSERTIRPLRLVSDLDSHSPNRCVGWHITWLWYAC